MNRRDILKTLPAAMAASLAAQSEPGKKARFRSALCAYSFRTQMQSGQMSYDDLVRLAVDLDLDGLDLTVYWFPSTSDDFLLPLRRLAYRNAVEIYSLCIRTNLCRPAGGARDKEAADLRAWVDVASKLGSGHIRVFGGKVPQGSTEEQAVGWATEMLRDASKYAGSKGVILGLENDGGITDKASNVVNIVKAVDSPWVGINLDTGNYSKDGYRQVSMCVPWAVNVQFKTHIRDENGNSEPADWPRLARMFRDSGYRGYFSLEYEEKGDPKTEVPRLSRELNKLVRQA